MKKKVIGCLCILAIAAVAVFNLNLNTQNENISLFQLTNVEALADNESGGGWEWNCKTYVSDTYSEERWDYEGQCYGKATWVTYACNNGILSWCYPGYILTYSDCSGRETGRVDNTNTSGCL